MRVRLVDELADDLGHVGDRRQLVGIERLREHGAACAGSSRRCSESVWPIAWTIPPSTWLRAPSGLMILPTSWIAATRSTRTSPVSTSTATSATWTPNVSTRIPVGFGPRAPVPRICASSSRPSRSSSGHEPPSEQTIAAALQRERARLPVPALRRELEDLPAQRPPAAERTAGPIDGIVDEPAESVAYGPRAESPSSTATRSSGRPSSSAAICAIAVREPVPMSCIAVTTVARPSEPTRTHAYEGGPPPPYQTWLARPTPRLQGSVERARTSCRRSQCFSARR